MTNLNFKEWLKQKNEMVGTYVVSPKKSREYNIWGAPGANYTATPKEDPIMKKKRK